MSRKGVLAFTAMAVTILAIAQQHYAVISTERFFGGTTVTYIRALPWEGQGLTIKLAASPSPKIDYSRVYVTAYGWWPNGSITELAEGKGQAAVPPRKLLAYLRAWAKWGRKHGLSLLDFEPPALILVAAPSRDGKVVLLDAYAATLRLDLLLNGHARADVLIQPHGSIKVKTNMLDKLMHSGSKSPYDFPPKEIPLGLYYKLELVNYRILYDRYMPLVVAYIHGPDKKILDRVHEKMLLYSNNENNLNLVFNIMSFTYEINQVNGGIEVLGYTIPGPSFKLNGDRVWIDMQFETYLVQSSQVLPEYCRATPSGPYCFYAANHMKEHIAVPALSSHDYLISLGLEADVAEAEYQLMAISEDGTYWIPLPIFYNVTMARPLIVHNLDTGEVFISAWAESAPFSMLSRAKAFNAFMQIETRWSSVDLGWFSGGYDVDNWMLASRVGTVNLLSAGLGLGVRGLDVGLLEVSVGAENSEEHFSFVFVNFDVKLQYMYTSVCKLWLQAYESPVRYNIYDSKSGRTYNAAMLYVDAYAEINGCMP